MRLSQLVGGFAFGCSLAFLPLLASAQSGGLPVKPARNTQYVFRNGEVLERTGSQSTPLQRNIRLPNGTKINVKSGIVEFPTGKISSLHEGDYINAEGGIVYATPASAAAARGDYSVGQDAKYDPYVHVGTAATAATADAPNEREQLLMRKIELLNRKVALLQQTHPNAPSTEAVDKQIQDLDAQIKSAKKPDNQ